MPIPSYTLGYPPDGSSLGQTKSTIRNNLDGTFETLNVDHVNNNGQPGSKPAGYHTVIHQVSQASVTTVNGYNQVFAGIPGTLSVNMTLTPDIPSNGDTQLYSLSGAGVLSQLTGSSLATDGYAWVGGILLQWGKTSVSNMDIPVTFTPNFPNNAFNVQITPIRAGGGGSFTTNFSATGLSTSGFTIVNGDNGATSLAFYWLAIGN